MKRFFFTAFITFFLFIFFNFLSIRVTEGACILAGSANCNSCSCGAACCNGSQTCTGYDNSTFQSCTGSQSCNVCIGAVSCDCGPIDGYTMVSCTGGSVCQGALPQGCHYCTSPSTPSYTPSYGGGTPGYTSSYSTPSYTPSYTASYIPTCNPNGHIQNITNPARPGQTAQWDYVQNCAFANNVGSDSGGAGGACSMNLTSSVCPSNCSSNSCTSTFSWHVSCPMSSGAAGAYTVSSWSKDSFGNTCTSTAGLNVCVANQGQACTSAANACGFTGSGVIQCDGSCSASTPALPSYYGQACSVNSAPNSCGQVNTNTGTYNCSGVCSATAPTPPANPAWLGQACTLTSPSDSCGDVNKATGTEQCDQSCAGSTPAQPYCVQGNIYIDTNKDKSKNAGESNFSSTSNMTIQSSSGWISNTTNGAYAIHSLAPGAYDISFQNGPPAGYLMTVPQSALPPPTWHVTVGTTGWNAGGSLDATNVSGDMSNLNFGIVISPWFQGVAGDMRIDSGFIDAVPSAQFASIKGTQNTNGLIFTGSASPFFGSGQASSTNWVVGGSTGGTSETFTPATAGTVRTSYSYIVATAQQNSITQNALPSSCTTASGCDITSLAHGYYSDTSNGLVTISGGNITGGNVVIATSGDISITGNITVANGSTLTVVTNGNISVAGGASQPTRIDGIFSAGKSFTVNGIGGAPCTTADQQLVIQGSVIVNANLTGGTFGQQRDLCAADGTTPAVQLVERPDFYLNAPDMLKHQTAVWQEIAP